MSTPTLVRSLAGRAPALLREQQFRRYWTGQTVSLFGDEVSYLAVPLAAVFVLHVGATGMGWLRFAGLLPALLFSLPAGAWADRRGRRRQTMIAADLARAALMASLPLGYRCARAAPAAFIGPMTARPKALRAGLAGPKIRLLLLCRALRG